MAAFNLVSMAGHCLHCGKRLMGRNDKKFCDSHCRSIYHQKVEKGVQPFIRKINYQLRKNRRILKELNPGGKTRCTSKELLMKGFDFDLHTSIYTNKEGKAYYFCYEYGYLPLANEYYFLVKKRESVSL